MAPAGIENPKFVAASAWLVAVVVEKSPPVTATEALALLSDVIFPGVAQAEPVPALDPVPGNLFIEAGAANVQTVDDVNEPL